MQLDEPHVSINWLATEGLTTAPRLFQIVILLSLGCAALRHGKLQLVSVNDSRVEAMAPATSITKG